MAEPTRPADPGPPAQARPADPGPPAQARATVNGPPAQAADAGAPVTVRYFAGAQAAAGRTEETASAGRSLDELVVELTARHGERLAVVLKAASFLVDGVTCHDRRAPLPAGATIDVLPPFAGG